MSSQQDVDSQFKYMQVYEWLKNQIIEGKLSFGARLPSENMLCNKFNLSRQTVRKALNQLQSENYIESAKGSGSFVKIKMANNSIKNVGLLITYLDFYIFPSIFAGIENVLSANNIGIDIAVSHNRLINEKRFIEKLLKSDIAGLIVEGTKSSLPNSNIYLYKQLQEQRIPIMFFHNYYPEFKSYKVLMNDLECSYTLVNKLIENGHKKIAGIFKFDDMQGIERYKGYLKSFNEHNIEVDDEKIKWFTAINFNDPNLSKMINSFVKKLNGCTAVVCYCDIIARNLIDILKERGINVPEDISIVSFDDSQLANQDGLKVVSAVHPKYEMGEYAAETMVKMINNKGDFTTNYSKVFDVNISSGNSIKKIMG